MKLDSIYGSDNSNNDNNNNNKYIKLNKSIKKLKQDTRLKINAIKDIKKKVSNKINDNLIKINEQKQYFENKISKLEEKIFKSVKDSKRNTKMEVDSIKDAQKTIVNNMDNILARILALEQQLNDKNNDIKNLKKELLQIKQDNTEVSKILKYTDIDDQYFKTYYDLFMKAGYDRISKMKRMNHDTLTRIEITIVQHQEEILNAIEHFSVERGRERYRNVNIKNNDNIKREIDDYRSRSRSRNQRKHSLSHSNSKILIE